MDKLSFDDLATLLSAFVQLKVLSASVADAVVARVLCSEQAASLS